MLLSVMAEECEEAMIGLDNRIAKLKDEGEDNLLSVTPLVAPASSTYIPFSSFAPLLPLPPPSGPLPPVTDKRRGSEIRKVFAKTKEQLSLPGGLSLSAITSVASFSSSAASAVSPPASPTAASSEQAKEKKGRSLTSSIMPLMPRKMSLGATLAALNPNSETSLASQASDSITPVTKRGAPSQQATQEFRKKQPLLDYCIVLQLGN
jgi:hypothetical protein